MKSEHRHELAENDLSKILGRWMEAFDEHANKILSVIVVVALIAAGYIYWSRTSYNQQANGWTELAASSTPEEYETVADGFSGTVVGDWAQLRAANGLLHEGIRNSVTDRPASIDRLEEAKELFKSLTGSGHPAPVREQALNGLAMTLEALSDGDTEPAIAAYQKLLEEFPNTRFKGWATERIDALKTGSVQEFYAWFHKQNPKPADMPLPKDQGAPSTGSLDSILNGVGGDSGSPIGGSPFDDLQVPLGGSNKPSSTDEDDVNPFAPESADDAVDETADEGAEETANEAAKEPTEEAADVPEDTTDSPDVSEEEPETQGEADTEPPSE